MGCDIPKVIDFRSLPNGVQDDLMKAEILPTMWPRYRISGYERMFHYCLMTVTRRRMLCEASCHNLTPAGIENMYPSSTDKKHRDWINELMFTSWWTTDNVVDQLILAAFECVVSILREAGSPVMFVITFNAYQVCSCSRTRVLVAFSAKDWQDDPEIGGYEGYSLPKPVATWYWSFYTDYMTYLDIAGRDSILAAQVASSGTQVTIQFIAMALEQAERNARASEQSLHEYRHCGAVTQDENCEWLMNHDFFMGNNGTFATVRVVKVRLQHWMRPLLLPSQEAHWRLLVYPAHPHQHQGQYLV